MKTMLHIFAGAFSDRVAATSYTEERWAPEPGEEASDEEYAVWEAVNPRWAMRDELGLAYLDPDFIETLHDQDEDAPDPWAYLGGLLRDDDALRRVRGRAASANTLVLIFAQALDDPDAGLRSTTRLDYCGSYPASSAPERAPA